MASSFAAVIGKWAKAVPEAVDAVFKNSAQRLVKELNDEVTKLVYDAPEVGGYKRTGFLRASLVASSEAMPSLVTDGAEKAADAHMGPITLVIQGWEGDTTLYLGYTAAYGARIHFGYTGPDSLGRTFNQTPRPWVTLVAQRWNEIVKEEAAKVKQAFGL